LSAVTLSTNLFDYAFAVAFMGANAAIDMIFVTPLQRAPAASAPRARVRAYVALSCFLWFSAACVCGLWLAQGRDWALLHVSVSPTWGLAAGLAIAVLALVVVRAQRVRLIARVEAKPDQRVSFGAALDALAPRSRFEHKLFAQLSIAAGVCEELICRGFLLALMTSLCGLYLGALLSAALFGLAHAYQGGAGMLRTGAFGLVATIVVLVTGSLIPMIIIHAAVDLSAGDLAFRLIGEGRPAPATSASPQT
jgi:membrane protease YdiL (CAAX protease family)